MRLIVRFIAFVLRTAILFLALALGVLGLSTLGTAEGPPPALTLGGAVMLLFVWWRLRRRSRERHADRGGTSRATVPATIMRIWQDPRPGAPGIYWTYVLFDVRGERIPIHLSKGRAQDFLARHGPGDVGRLAWKGQKLLAWEPATAERPVDTRNVTAFISYERSWSDDAQYVAQFLRSRGVDAWIDADELRAGSELGKGVEEAIGGADVFVPLLSRSYWTSAWCLRELEVARRRGVPIRSVKVEQGRMIPPPHMRDTASAILDEAVYLDLRGRDPVAQLDHFALALGSGR